MLVRKERIQDDPKLWIKKPGGQYFYSLNDGMEQEKVVGREDGGFSLGLVMFELLYNI